jgi:hypothetical protein
MKQLESLTWLLVTSFIMILTACGGGGSGDATGGTGTLQMSITDAKPQLPADVTNLFVTFDEVRVHKSGGGWISLPLVEAPYTIDLLQFQDGNTTELVPPTRLGAGKYTQVRLGVTSATIRFDNGGTTEDRTVDVPSGNLKTNKNFVFDVTGDAAVDIVIHFDLSMSLVAIGPPSNPSYKLKPVFKLFGDPLEAATIEGRIDNSAFTGPDEAATIIVVAESNQEEYTRVVVPKSGTDPTEFNIFWIVPNQSYTVKIDLDQNGSIDCRQDVAESDVEEGEIFLLNGEDPIEPGIGICS